MLRFFIQKIDVSRWSKPRVLVCVPSGITGVEQRAVQDAAEYAGARRPVYLIEEPMAAAIGADMPVHEPSGNMIVDIGGGTTEVAVISLGGIVSSLSVRVGGDELDAAIVDWVRREHSLAIGDRTAEEVKIAMGSAWPLDQEMIFEVGGKDLITGLPKSVEIATEDVREALSEPVSAIIDAVKQALDRTPPELAADIMERGIILSGGGALLAGLDRRMQSDTGMPVYLAPEPLLSVVIGTGRALENIEAMKGLFSQPGFD
jgi:rod shape-determining protein MreB